ncbi:UNVERIFIED_CONTAM: hypothetical protein GTU68_057444 [Idotea baltica]|nr:hypothetical protein [Idotea baltica]
MEIILLKYQKGLGEKDDIVSVKPGYARNFLIPQGIAILATATNKKIIAENLRQAAHRKEHIINEAKSIAEALEKIELKIETLAGPDGRLFGSVTPLMVIKKLEEAGHTVERQRVAFEAPIKEVGTHGVIIDLHKEVKAKLNIEVIAADRG